MKWKPKQGAPRSSGPIGSKLRLLIGLFVVVLSIFLLPLQSISALEEIKNGTDISTLDIHKFDLNVNNVSVLSQSPEIDQFHIVNPSYEYLGANYPGVMENFSLRVDKSKKQDQVFDNPLALKFTNVGTVYGKQVDAYLTFNRVTLHYLNTAQAESEMNSSQKQTVEFFSISDLWESKAFEIGNVPYVDAAHNYIMNKAFWVDADVTAELRYADGSETDLKLVMKPTDIDAIDANNLKESFYVKDYNNHVNLRLMNNANVLSQSSQGDWTKWEATQITGGSYAENNVSGLALRSVDNKLNFGYSSTESCSAVFGLYIEKLDPKPTLTVDPGQIPAKEGQTVSYTASFKVPVPGKDILAAPTTMEMTEEFDERLDYKELKVEAGGTSLQEGRDYTIEQTGQTVTVKMTPAYLQGGSSADIVVSYKTETNQKAAEKGAASIENTVTLKVDNLSAPSNQVSTDLLYEKSHEFVSGTRDKELPKEVTDLLPATEKNLANASKVTPTAPSPTEVKVADGTWKFRSYDENEKTIDGENVKFVGTWDFTPNPTYKASHEFVSGTSGKQLPKEVTDLLPADKSDLADGTKVTPTAPTSTEVKVTDGTWTFRSYDENEKTIAGADVHFVGTWDFTPNPTYKASHEFVSGTSGKQLPKEITDLLPAEKSDLADGSKVTPTAPSPTEVKVSDGTWTFRSYDENEKTIAGGDVYFVGTWDFTPNPTYKASHEFVSGTSGKQLPKEVTDLLPADKSDLADGAKVKPTAPAQTEVKSADGTWTFKSYDKAEETIAGADVHFIGTWDFTPNPTYKASHEFVSGTKDKELPKEVTDLLPADKSDLADGTKVTPTAPTSTEVKVADGTWKFRSYDENEKTIDGENVKFVGTWDFTPNPTYKASHEFVSGTSGKQLPKEVTDLLPADKSDLADGTKVTPTAPTPTEVKVTDGTWTFKSYDENEKTIAGADVKFVGTWDFTPNPTYKASHEFVSGTSGKQLPKEVTDLLPADKSDLVDGTKVTPTAPTPTEVKVADGTWKFRSYDENEKTIDGENVKFVGTWDFTPNPTYKASHEFVSGTKDKELPKEVTDLLPADKSDLADETKVTPTAPTSTEVKVADGTWTFKSYDKTEETIAGADVHFVGTWDFTPNPTYKASHEFVSGTNGKQLPKEVTDLLPADKSDLADGAKVTPTAPTSTEVKVVDGTWTFRSYDENEKTVAGADVHFIGTWDFTPNPTYKASHEFVSGTSDKQLPKEVTDLLPADKSDLADGAKVTPTEPTSTEVKVADGTWTFKSYDKTEETIAGADVHFVGTWDFTPNPTPAYKAVHEFISGTAGKELPQEVKALTPSDQTDLADGTKVTPTTPSPTEVKVADGTWTFKSYDKTEETIAGADVHFVGTWDFTPTPTPVYKAVHEFISGTAGKELPQEVKSLTPSDQTDLADGSKVTPTAPTSTEVKAADGTWKFRFYDKTEETISGADVKFVGTWDFTPNPTYKASHEFVSGTSGKELPQEVKALIPSDQTDLADGTKVTPTAPSPTEVKVADGTWKFRSYDENEKTIDGENVKFVGTWDFTPNPTYKASHEFVSGTNDKQLPKEVTDLLPADKSDLADGIKVTPTAPTSTEVKVADGTWKFRSYDENEKTITGADVHFVGTWDFTPNPTYKSSHEFVSGTSGKQLPKEVTDLLPADKSDLADGTKVTPTAPTSTEVKVADGTWTFKSYDKTEETIAGGDVRFVGTWDFTPNPTPTPVYKAVHEFISGTAGKELPQEVKALIPSDQTDLADGTKVTPTEPSPTEVKVTDGTWTFRSYDENEKTVAGADVKFVGTWDFTPNPTPTPVYKAVHEFISGTAGKELPQEVKALTPSDQTDLADGSKVTPTAPTSTEVKVADGTWTFKSYDKAEESIAGADVKFVGSWEFSPASQPTPNPQPQPKPAETINISGKVIWQDNQNASGRRPQSVTVHLLADGQETGLSLTVTEEMGWSYSFQNLPRFKDGKEISYSIREEAVDGYSSQVDGLNVTNRLLELSPGQQGQSADSGTAAPSGGKQQILPKTGQTSSLWMVLNGFLLVLAAAGWLKRKA